MSHDHSKALEHICHVGESAENLIAAHSSAPIGKFHADGISKVGLEAVTVCAFCPFVGQDARQPPTELSSQEKQATETNGKGAQ